MGFLVSRLKMIGYLEETHITPKHVLLNQHIIKYFYRFDLRKNAHKNNSRDFLNL